MYFKNIVIIFFLFALPILTYADEEKILLTDALVRSEAKLTSKNFRPYGLAITTLGTIPFSIVNAVTVAFNPFVCSFEVASLIGATSAIGYPIFTVNHQLEIMKKKAKLRLLAKYPNAIDSTSINANIIPKFYFNFGSNKAYADISDIISKPSFQFGIRYERKIMGSSYYGSGFDIYKTNLIVKNKTYRDYEGVNEEETAYNIKLKFDEISIAFHYYLKINVYEQHNFACYIKGGVSFTYGPSGNFVFGKCVDIEDEDFSGSETWISAIPSIVQSNLGFGFSKDSYYLDFFLNQDIDHIRNKRSIKAERKYYDPIHFDKNMWLIGLNFGREIVIK